MGAYIAKPPCPALRWDHPLVGGGAPLCSLYPAGTGASAVRDLAGNAWEVRGGVTMQGGPYGPAWKFDGSSGYLHNERLSLPTAGCTALVVISAPAAGSAGSAFGNIGSNDASRLQAHAPYSGSIYWDFGVPSGANRISWAPPAGFFGEGSWHAMAFRAGVRGTSIWSDGVMVQSGASPISRSASTPGLDVGAWPSASIYGDNAIDSFHLFPRELADAEIRAWSSDPHEHVRSRSRSIFYTSASSVSTPTTPVVRARRVRSYRTGSRGIA